MAHQNSSGSDMRVAVYDRYGTPEVLHVAHAPRPVPTSDEVLIEVAAFGVNSVDVVVRAGKGRLLSSMIQGGFPKRTGVEYAGRVAAVGADVSGVEVGDIVWGHPNPRLHPGAAADYIVARTDEFSPAPRGVDLVEAASLPVAGGTALAALIDHAGIRPGMRLLVRGASGGVGSIAVQYGKAIGAHVVGLAGSKNLEFVRELGADEVFDYRTTNPGQLGRFDVILDTVGTDLRAFRALLRTRGRLVTVALGGNKTPIRSMAYTLASAIHGSRRVRLAIATLERPQLARLAELVEQGAIRPRVDAVFPLADIATAHGLFEEGGVRGKIVVRVG